MDKGKEPAFPTDTVDPNLGTVSEGGLTKRELFAAMAMQGILAGRPVDGMACSDTRGVSKEEPK